MKKTNAIRIHETGGPEVMVWEEVVVAEPEPGEVLLRQTAVGLNYIDTYHRSGLYPLPGLPAILGREAAGVVEAVGRDVDGLRDFIRPAEERSLAFDGRNPVVHHRIVEQAEHGIAVCNHGDNDPEQRQPLGEIPGPVNGIDDHREIGTPDPVEQALVAGDRLLANDGGARHQLGNRSMDAGLGTAVGIGHQIAFG